MYKKTSAVLCMLTDIAVLLQKKQTRVQQKKRYKKEEVVALLMDDSQSYDSVSRYSNLKFSFFHKCFTMTFDLR